MWLSLPHPGRSCASAMAGINGPSSANTPQSRPVMTLDPSTDRSAAGLFAEMLSMPRTQATLDWFLLSVARLTEAPVGLASPAAVPPWLHHALVQFSQIG